MPKFLSEGKEETDARGGGSGVAAGVVLVVVGGGCSRPHL